MEEIEITHLTEGLEGSGRLASGRNLTFPFTLPGDRLEIQMIPKRRRKASVQVIGSKSVPRTTEPACPHFSHCGGCLAQHIPYSTQFSLLTDPLIASYQKELGFSPNLIPASRLYQYRSRMDFAIFPRERFGLRERGNFRRIVPIEYCSLQKESANLEWARTRELLKRFPNLPWDRKSQRGGLKYVTIRTAEFLESHVIVFTFTEGFETDAEYLEFREAAVQELKFENLVFCFNRFSSEVSSFGRPVVLRGEAGYSEIIFGKKLFVPFDSFFQPNLLGFLPILEFMNNNLPKEKRSFCDMFCGNGFFSQILGEGFSRIDCLELNQASLKIAESSLKELYPLSQLNFYLLDLHKAGLQLPSSEHQVLVVDPPRSGLGSYVSNWLKTANVEHLFYVSCNPHSQIEDCKKFLESFDFQAGILTDPYPHTPHLESVLYFRRKLAK